LIEYSNIKEPEISAFVSCREASSTRISALLRIRKLRTAKNGQAQKLALLKGFSRAGLLESVTLVVAVPQEYAKLKLS
jgi:hypothetical protein